MTPSGRGALVFGIVMVLMGVISAHRHYRDYERGIRDYPEQFDPEFPDADRTVYAAYRSDVVLCGIGFAIAAFGLATAL